MTAPRFVVVQRDTDEHDDPFLLAVLGLEAVVDRETDMLYPFGFVADEAAAAFNDGSRSVDEGFDGRRVTDTERARVAEVVEALS